WLPAHAYACADVRSDPKSPRRVDFTLLFFCVRGCVHAPLSRLQRRVGVSLAHEIGEHVTLGVDDLRHPILCDIELPGDQACVGLVPAPLISVCAGIDDLLPLAVLDAVVRLASLP